MFKKLSVKLTAGIIIVLTVVTAIFIPLYMQTQKQAYIDSELKTMENFYNGFKDISFLSSSYDIDKYIEENDNRNYTIIICDEVFNKVYSSSGVRRNAGMQYDLIAKNIEKFSKNAVPEYIDGTGSKTEQILFRKIQKQDNIRYYVYISEGLDATNSVLAYTNRNIVIIIMGYMIVCAVVLIFLISSSIKSIRQLSNVTEKISQKDYSVRYDGRITDDEIGTLAKNINEMADTIQENINSLSNYNFLLKEDLNYMTEYDNIRKSVISNVTHELKTPLAIISSQVEMMNCLTDKEKKDFYYNSAMEEIEKMSRLISNLLNYSVTEYDIFEDEIKVINLSRVIRQMCEKHRNYILSRKIILHTEIDDNCVLNMAPRHIEHVFNNYLSNAISHTNPDGQISVRLEKLQDKVRFSLYNQGKTIPEEYKDKIWTNFFTSHKKLENSEDIHAGLGLFIVKEISTLNHTGCGFINHSNGVEFWFDFISREI